MIPHKKLKLTSWSEIYRKIINSGYFYFNAIFSYK